MASTNLQDREREHARQAVERFVNRFEPSYLLLACHAALPLVLTPELLNYLRNTFLRAQVPWVAEVDLLLSDLCSQVGYEQYVMEPSTRRYLLDVLRTHADLGPERAGEVARLLLNYIRQLDRSDPFSGQSELQAQRWAAMAFLVDQRDALVQEIAESFRKCLASGAAAPATDGRPVDLAELARLSRVVQIMAPELGEDHELIKLAKDLDPRQAPGPSDVMGEPSGTDLAGERAQTSGLEMPTAEDMPPSDRSAESVSPASEERPGESQEEIEHQRQLLAAHRHKLSTLLKQMAQLGGTSYAPSEVTQGINEARTGIERAKSLLRASGVTVEDLPDDEEASTRILDLPQEPAIRAAMLSVRAGLEDARRQIDRLASYKEIHDLLHTLEYQCYSPLAREIALFSDDPATLDRLTDYELTLHDTIRGLQEVADRGLLATETARVQDLVQADEDLRSGIENADQQLLNRALTRIDRVLAIQPSRINVRLVDAARSIRIENLLQSFRFVPGGIDERIAELGQLYRDLNNLVDEHDRWQAVDDELRRIERGLEYDLSELAISWPDLKGMMAQMYGDRSDQWSKALQADAENLDEALVTQDVAKARTLFRRLRRRAGDRFFRVDTDLKRLCNRLRIAIEPLASVLRVIE